MKTAVEFLIEKTFSDYGKSILRQEIKMALEMEKQQIIESYCYGCKDISNNENIFPRETAEEYYNKTYDKKNG